MIWIWCTVILEVILSTILQGISLRRALRPVVFLVGLAKDSKELQISLVGVVEKEFALLGCRRRHCRRPRKCGAGDGEAHNKPEAGDRERSGVRTRRCDNVDYSKHRTSRARSGKAVPVRTDVTVRMARTSGVLSYDSGCNQGGPSGHYIVVYGNTARGEVCYEPRRYYRTDGEGSGAVASIVSSAVRAGRRTTRYQWKSNRANTVPGVKPCGFIGPRVRPGNRQEECEG